MRWGLRIATAAALAALVLLDGCPGPIYDPAKLKAVEAESVRLMAAYPIDPAKGWAEVPKGAWPPAIASLRPEIVILDRKQVLITIKPYFDGGWGYEVVGDKSDIRSLPACYRELIERVYWHGPC